MNPPTFNSYFYGNLAVLPNVVAIAQLSSYPIIKRFSRPDISTQTGFVKLPSISPEKPILEMGFISDMKSVTLNNIPTLIVCSNFNIFSFSEDGEHFTKYSMTDNEDDPNDSL